MKNKNVYRKIEKPSGVEVTYPTLVDLVSLYKDDFGVFELIYNNGEVIADESDSEYVMTKCGDDKFDAYIRYLEDGVYEYIGELYPGDVLGWSYVVKQCDVNAGKRVVSIEGASFPTGMWLGVNITGNNVGVTSKDSIPLYRNKVDKSPNYYGITRYKWDAKYNTNKVYFEVNGGDRVIEINDPIKDIATKLAKQMLSFGGGVAYRGVYSLIKIERDASLSEYIDISKGLKVDHSLYDTLKDMVKKDSVLNIHYKVIKDLVTGNLIDRGALWLERDGVNHFLTEMTISV